MLKIIITIIFHLHSDRIMVTLSCLIVLASLFSQMSSTLPASASAKALDIMFIGQIIHLTLVFVNLTILDIVRRKEDSDVLFYPRYKKLNDHKLISKPSKKFSVKGENNVKSSGDILDHFPESIWTFYQKLELILTFIEVIFFIFFYISFFLYVYLGKREVFLTFYEIRHN